MKIYFSLFLCCLFLSTHAQIYDRIEDQKALFGAYGAYTNYKYQGLNRTLIDPLYDTSTFTFETKKRHGIESGIFLYYRMNVWTALQLDMGYHVQYNPEKHRLSDAFYSDNDVGWTLQINYQHFTFAPKVKIYPLNWVDHYLPGSFQVNFGFPISIANGRSNLDYISTKPFDGPDEVIEERLERIIKNRSEAAFNLGAGFDFALRDERSAIFIDVSYSFGMSDVIEVGANNYGLSDNFNRRGMLRAKIGFALTINPDN